MLAYSGAITKEAFVAELEHHKAQDSYVKGTYWEEGKGCAVGCAIESINKLTKQSINHSSHIELERAGICPEWLATIQDSIFEELSMARAKEWPLEFARAINVGSDLNKVKLAIICYILEQNISTMQAQLEHVTGDAKYHTEQALAVNKQMLKAQLSGDRAMIESARDAARSAADSPYYSVRSVRSTIESARSASSTVESVRSAVDSAVDSAAFSARLARLYSADSSYCSVRSAYCSAHSEAWAKYANKLLKL